jgi:hypothetical protein
MDSEENEIRKLQQEIDKERDDLFKFSIFLDSLKNVVNYMKTGDPFDGDRYD